MVKKTWLQKTFIIYPTSLFNKVWRIVVIFVCLVTAVLYPFLVANGGLLSRNLNDPTILALYSGELVMLGDVIFNFLLAYEEEEGFFYVTNFKKIALRYIKQGSFISDIIVLIPWYIPLGIMSPTLEITAMIKSVRFK